MVAIRNYLNVAQAELAKSLLDDYGIFCVVAHENAHLYGGSPFAMPIQLLVDESQASQAIAILDGKIESEPVVETSAPDALVPSEREIPDEIAKDNPWELLVIAALFLLPGIWGLRVKYSEAMTSGQRDYSVIVAVSTFHFFALLAIAFAVCLVAGYVWLRWPRRRSTC